MALDNQTGGLLRGEAMSSRFRYLAWLLCAVTAGVVACADQGEGDRCDPLNGNNDCASGLICVRAEKLALVETGAVCCPPPGQDENAVKECRGDLQVDGGNPINPVSPGNGVSTDASLSDASADATP